MMSAAQQLLLPPPPSKTQQVVLGANLEDFEPRFISHVLASRTPTNKPATVQFTPPAGDKTTPQILVTFSPDLVGSGAYTYQPVYDEDFQALRYDLPEETQQAITAWHTSFDASLYTSITSGTSTTATSVYYQQVPGVTAASTSIPISWVAGEYITSWEQRSSPAELAKEQIQRNLSSNSRRKRQGTLGQYPEELKARSTLRDMISEEEYRRYLTNSFLMVKGPSGKWYQVFADQRRTKVYEKGELIAEICIHTDRSCPPTDHVINLKVLLEIDEAEVWVEGNVTWLSAPDYLTVSTADWSVTPESPTPGNLLEIFKKGKAS